MTSMNQVDRARMLEASRRMEQANFAEGSADDFEDCIDCADEPRA